jgi:hypothetical protein
MVLHKKLLSAAEEEEGKHKQLGSMNHTAVSADTSTPMKPKNTNIVNIIIVIM